MTVRDLLEMDVSVDVYDNVVEDIAIAFEGPVRLTSEGETYFNYVLDCDVEFPGEGESVAIIDIDTPDWANKLEIAKELFRSMAGFCSCSDYDRWFLTE